MSILYLSPYLISLFLTTGIAVYAFSSRRGRAIRAYGWMCVVGSLGISLFLLENFLPDIESRIALNFIRTILLIGLPLAFLAIVQALRGDPAIEKTKWFWALFAVPAVYAAFGLIPAGRGLVMVDPRLRVNAVGMELIYGYGPVYLAATACVFIFFAFGIIRLAFGLRKLEGRRFVSVILVIACAILPLALSGFSYLKGDLFLYRDASPLAMGLACLVILVPMIRFHIFDNIPYAESLAFMELPEAVLIFGDKQTLLEANKSARYLFGLGSLPYTGTRTASLLDRLGGLADELDGDGGTAEISVTLGNTPRDYSILISPLCDRGRRVGTVASFTDVTSINRAGLALRRMRDGLESMVEERTADLREEVQRRREAENLLLILNEELRSTQKEIMLTLSEIVENRSKETANHVLRVAQYSYIIALACGVNEERAALMRDAAPLHDIGKVAIPDRILNKPSGLEAEEWDIMRTHTEIGYDILKSSQRDLLKIAAIIAREHHERWDGNGYPRGLKGEDISLEGRIVSLADVVDALFSRRNYKEPWDLEEIEEYVRSEKGKHFQPEIVDAFTSEIAVVREIIERYPDAYARAAL
jgi:putative nucleotidyltransferase with HDIG domain